jgi:pimeloyl-ACP methyl ester carboxylesterase
MNDKPIINLVHANGFPAGSYKTFLSYFEPEFDCVALDQYGHNPKFPCHHSWKYLVDELITFLQQQKAPVISIGHSFGGVLTFMAACKAPELFKGIVLLDPPVMTGPISLGIKLIKRTSLIDKLSPAGKSKIRREHWPLEANISNHFSRSKLFRNFDPRCLQDYVNSGIKIENNQQSLIFDREVETNIFRNMPTHLASFKGKLTVPAAFLYGENTDVCIPKFVQRFAKQQPNMVFQCVKQGGHMFPMEQPEQVSAQIKALIKPWLNK